MSDTDKPPSESGESDLSTARRSDDPTVLIKTMMQMMTNLTAAIVDLKISASEDKKTPDASLNEFSRPEKARRSEHSRGFTTGPFNDRPAYDCGPGPGRMIQLERYSGNTKTLPANWMRSYEAMATFQNWSDQCKASMLRFYLADEAVTWLDNQLSVGPGTLPWYELKQRFEKFFSQDQVTTPKAVLEKEWDPKTSSFYEHYREMLRLFEISGLQDSWRVKVLKTSLPPYYARMCSGIETNDTDEWYKRAANIITSLPKFEPKATARTQVRAVAAMQDMRAISRKAPVDMHDTTDDPSKCLFCCQINPNHKLEDCYCHPRKLRAAITRRNINVLEEQNEDSSEVLSEADLEEEDESLEMSVLTTGPSTTGNLIAGEESINTITGVSNKVKMIINNIITVEGLLDSGATVSAISEDLCSEWKIDYKPLKKDLASVQGSFWTKGVVFVNIMIGPHQGKVKAYVLESPPYPFILGINEFKTFGIAWTYPYLLNTGSEKAVAQVEVADADCKREQTIDRAVVQQLNEKYKSLFSKHDFDVGHTALLECSIHLRPGSVPHHVPARRLSLKLQQEEVKQVKTLLENKLIQPSFSEWAAGITFVCKEGKTPRLCGDYRKLNDVTICDRYPIPRIDFILDQLKGACIFSKLDLTRGYNNLGICEEDRYKTAFITNVGLFEWRVVPFGLKNAPALFQRCMEIVLSDCKDFAKVYFDDILVHSTNAEQHLKDLETTYKILTKHGLKLKKEKCLFMEKQVTFCGYVISNGTVKRDTTFVEAIDRVRVPRDEKELTSFMGLANYGRRFIANFAEIARPLNELRKKNIEYVWKPEHQACFDKLKQVLKDAPSLHLFDPLLKSILYTDSSQWTVGAVLVQLKADQDEKIREYPIGFFSKNLNSAQLKYDIYTKEFLALKDGINFFKEYLYGRKFTVVTDNTALSYIKTSKEVLDKKTRWLMTIEQFDFELVHKPSCQNKAADALSRITTRTNSESLCAIPYAIRTLVREANESEDPLSVPANRIKMVLDYFHKFRTNHGGFEKIQPMISKLFKIPHNEIKNYLLGCYPCRMVNTSNVKVGYTRPMESPQQVNDRWHMDFIQGLPKYQGRGNVLIVIDQLSRYVRAYAIGKISVEEVKDALRRAFRSGIPKIIVVDNATCFTSGAFKEFCASKNVRLVFSPAHHHQSNGLAERVLKTIQEALTKYIIEENASWWVLLPGIIRKYNSTVHRSLGATPKQVYDGVVDATAVLSRTEQQQQYDAERLNKNVHSSKFKVGDLVLLKMRAAKRRKLKSKRSGPFRIVQLISQEIVEIESPTRRLPTQDGVTRVHVNDIVLYKPM